MGNMNEVSIIINGVRYDAVKSEKPLSCEGCEIPMAEACCICDLKGVFKKSTKSFER
jgi:hypothetical protein